MKMPVWLRHLLRAMFRDFRELEDQAAQAAFDPMTGLLNRRGAEYQLESLLHVLDREGRRQGSSSLALMPFDICVAVIDVNNFKLINDTLGHHGGDEVLRRLAGHTKDAFRRAREIVCRPGGDEIYIYFVNTTKQEAVVGANKLVAMISGDEALTLDKEHHVTVSIGIAHGRFMRKRGGLQAIERITPLADAAMYAAKTSGPKTTSRVVVEPESSDSDSVLGSL